jgi:Tfp pilus assembly protein PilZ
MVRHFEKRNEKRTNYKSPVIVENCEVGFIYNGRMINYSKKGLYFETDMELQPGAEIYLGIENSPYATAFSSQGSYPAKIIWRRDLRDIFFNYGYGAKLDINVSEESLPSRKINNKDLRKNPRKSYVKTTYFTAQNQYYKGSINNISRSGAFIETKSKFLIGQIIKLIVPKPKVDKGIVLKSEVVRLSSKGIGVRFKGIIKRKSHNIMN